MKKKFPLFNFILYGGFSCVTILCFIFGLFSDTTNEGLVALGLTCGGSILVFILFFLTWYFSRPKFITKHGVAVWTDGIAIITKEVMEQLLDFYITTLPNLYSRITTEQLDYMLKGVCIEWSRNKLSTLGLGWKVRDKAGLQSGRNIKVRFVSKMHKSALFHELHHMVDEIVLNHVPDYTHAKTNWWALILLLQKEYENKIV